MPQMMPYSWTFVLLLTAAMLMMMAVILHYNDSTKTTMEDSASTKFQIKW